MRFTIAWEHNVLPYGVDCTDRIQTVRRGRRTLRDSICLLYTSVTAVYTRAVDGTAAALDTISARLVESEKENKLLKAQVDVYKRQV